MANTHLKPGKLTVDLGALKNNYRLFRSMTSARVAAAVKADGYGVGMVPVARALIEEGCDTFFVATADEGATLRAQNDKIQIAVLGGLMHGVEEDYLQHTIHPVLNSLEMISRWQALSKKKGHKLQAIIHFDTGMNRLGLGEDETKTLLASPALLDGLDVKIIMSHFACSDEKDHPLNDLQAQRFAAIAKAFPKAVKSLSNSSGLFRNADWHHDMVRTGYALYGGNPTPETHNPVQSVVKLEVPVLQIRHVKKGETIGYAASHTFDADTTTATVALGYADGFARAHSNKKAQLFWNGTACPVIGRVSMDLVTIDLTPLGGDLPVPGNFMEVLGPHQGVDALAASTTIGYEILTSLGARYARTYL